MGEFPIHPLPSLHSSLNLGSMGSWGREQYRLGEGRMECMSCGQSISESFFDEKNGTEQFKGGRFGCPHCGAEHVRRDIGRLPSGKPLYTVRLWGHLTTVKKQPVPAGEVGGDRRGRSRSRPWR